MGGGVRARRGAKIMRFLSVNQRSRATGGVPTLELVVPLGKLLAHLIS